MIILINGSINSGKSTAASLLQRKTPNTAVVEIDSLRKFIDWMPLEQSIPINLKNAASIINNFHSEGLSVIATYPLSEENYQFLTKHLDVDQSQLFAITLAPKLDHILKNRGTRHLSDWERKRIKYHYKIGIHKPDFGHIIDNSNQTPAETVDKILQIIDCKQDVN